MGMRYISSIYDEKFLVRKLALMRLTGDSRVLKPLHDCRGLVAATTAAATPDAKPTFSAAQLRTIMQSFGLTRAEAINTDERMVLPIKRQTTSRSLATSTPASRHSKRTAGRKRTYTDSTKPLLCQTPPACPAAPSKAGVTCQAAPSSPLHSSIAVVTPAPCTTHIGATTIVAPTGAASYLTITSGARPILKAS